MDWDDVKVFLEVERAGSVNGAALALRIDPSTVGRRLARLEQVVGSALFERSPGGSELTAMGERLRPEAERLEQAALGFFSAGSEELSSVSGTVRIATAELLFTGFLLPHLDTLRCQHPELSLELVTATATANLLKREADLALRPSTQRPSQKKIESQKLARLGYGLFASAGYIAERGRPTPGGTGHQIVGFDPMFGTLPQAAWIEENLPDARTSITANTVLSIAECCAAGWGIAALPCFIAARHQELVRIPGDLPEPDLWLMVHPELRRSARVRVVLDFLTQTVHEHRAELEGST